MIHTHILKLNSRYVGEILRGAKRFEVRNNDRSFQRGDEVMFTVVNDQGEPIEAGNGEAKEMYRTLEEMVFRITFVVTGYGLKEGYCVFGFEELTK
ncbi:MAG: DUF3850 domain-containing protein [Lachnospiraceae bacterium]|nr:DUF3850 domain-containing protein [Lachnospiraceae bacterium]